MVAILRRTSRMIAAPLAMRVAVSERSGPSASPGSASASTSAVHWPDVRVTSATKPSAVGVTRKLRATGGSTSSGSITVWFIIPSGHR